MYISSINIKNFRSFKDSGDLFLYPNHHKPISIIGYNNSGKSNILKSLFYISGAKWIDEKTFKEQDFHNFNLDEPINIIAETDDNTFTITSSYKEDGFDTRHLDNYNKNCYKKYDPKPVYLIEFDKVKDQLKIRGEYGNLTLLGKKVKEIKEDFKSQKTITKNPQGNDQEYPSSLFIKTIIEKHIEPNLRTEFFHKFENNLKININKILSLENELEITFDFPNYETFFDNLKFNISQSPNGRKIPIENTGNGFTALFVIALFESLINEDSKSIFLIDEPETFLHEHYQEHFYMVLKQLALKNQVVYTTHSKKFIDIFSPQTIIRVKNDNFIESKVIQPESNLLYEEDIITIYDKELKFPNEWGLYVNTIEPNLGNLPFSDKVIICEGCHDKIAYKTVLEKYLEEQQKSLSFENIAILSAEGKDTIKILIEICRHFHIPYFVIHDLDLNFDMIFDSRFDKDPRQHAVYNDLDPKDKTQYTKNWKIFLAAKNDKYIHRNMRKLETVLNIYDKDKSSESTYFAVKDKSIAEIQAGYPKFLPEGLLDFVDGKYPIEEYSFDYSDEEQVSQNEPQDSVDVVMPF
jgi:putative ATP-dependent endonuclease of OLD family